MGGERRVTGEIVCDSNGFGFLLFCQYDYDGTARPKAETKLLP